MVWCLGVCVIYTIYTGDGLVSWCLCDLYYYIQEVVLCLGVCVIYTIYTGCGLVSWCLCDLYLVPWCLCDLYYYIREVVWYHGVCVIYIWCLGCPSKTAQGRIGWDSSTRSHTGREVTHPTCYLTQSQHSETGSTSPCPDPIALVPGRVATGVHIEGSRSEWCVSSMIYSRDTPFWSETLDIFRSLVCIVVVHQYR